MVTITIDGRTLQVEEGLTILQAAQRVGIEIPALCYHPDLGPLPRSEARPEKLVYQRGPIETEEENPDFESIRCRLCVVEVEGCDELVTSCDTKVWDGMVIHTNTPRVQKERRKNLARILERYNHPSICLTCDRDEKCPPYSVCIRSAMVPRRCVACPAYGKCELERIVKLIGLQGVTTYYTPVEHIPITVSSNGKVVFEFDPNLCVGCLRCIRLCSELKGNRVIGFVIKDGKVFIGAREPSFKESGCKGCAACARVCPTGSLMLRPKGA